jgi:tRNA dimethylallyltransferase
VSAGLSEHSIRFAPVVPLYLDTVSSVAAEPVDPPLVAVVGPTASGKSAVALDAGRRLSDVELVSIDAMQVYRGMDIGTAKPTPSEQAEVAHHLIDLVESVCEFTVAEFQHEFERVVADLAARGRRGVLVGGTGLYHRAVIDGFTLPGEWPQHRQQAEEDAASLGTAALHARLAELDPVAAARMEPSNTRRVIRALEVTLGSGRPFSSFGPGLDTYPPSPVIQIGLRWSRPMLAARIEQRVNEMISGGLLEEVQRVLVAGMSRTARQALGYKELIDHLEGRVTLDEAVATIVVRTRQFAVRQERWFRRDPRIRWVDIADDPVAETLPVVAEAFDELEARRPRRSTR